MHRRHRVATAVRTKIHVMAHAVVKGKSIWTSAAAGDHFHY